MQANSTMTRVSERCTGPSLSSAVIGFEVPEGHVGPVLLSATGRTVWWTGRVAIGLRYEPPPHSEPCGQSAEWIQRVMLGQARSAVEDAGNGLKGSARLS